MRAEAAAPSVVVVRRTRLGLAGGIVAVAVLAVLVTVPWWASEGNARNLVEFFTLLALAQMWNLLAGYAGLVSIGQQAFIGIGAYSLYVFGDKWNVHPVRRRRPRRRSSPPRSRCPPRRSLSACEAATSRSEPG